MKKMFCTGDPSCLSAAVRRLSSSIDAATGPGFQTRDRSSAAHGQSCAFGYAFHAAWLRGVNGGYAYVGDQERVTQWAVHHLGLPPEAGAGHLGLPRFCARRTTGAVIWAITAPVAGKVRMGGVKIVPRSDQGVADGVDGGFA